MVDMTSLLKLLHKGSKQCLFIDWQKKNKENQKRKKTKMKSSFSDREYRLNMVHKDGWQDSPKTQASVTHIWLSFGESYLGANQHGIMVTGMLFLNVILIVSFRPQLEPNQWLRTRKGPSQQYRTMAGEILQYQVHTHVTHREEGNNGGDLLANFSLGQFTRIIVSNLQLIYQRKLTLVIFIRYQQEENNN